MSEAKKQEAAYELVGYLNQIGEEEAAELVIGYSDEHWTD